MRVLYNLVPLLFLCLIPSLRVAGETPPRTLTGHFVIHPNFHSRFLKRDRDLIVYLPPDYELHSRRRYPVLYMHDGQNLFDRATAFLDHEWRLDETAESLITAGMNEPLIIVGIYNTPGRGNEYTPVRDPRHNFGGEADHYGQMLVEELKPFIDAHYRTKKGARDTALGGSSLGGLVSLYLGLKYPKVFGNIAALSPSLWWDDQYLLKQVQVLPRKTRQKIWLDIGTEEDAEAVPQARAMRDALLAKGWTLDRDLYYLEAQGAKHTEDSWAARAPTMLRFLFPVPFSRRSKD